MELTINTHQVFQCPPIPYYRTTPLFPQQSSLSPPRNSYHPIRLVVLRADHTAGSSRKSIEDFNFDFELELNKMKQVSIDQRESDDQKKAEEEEDEENKCRKRKLIEELEGLEEEALVMGDDIQGREPIDYNRRAHMFDTCSRVFQGLKHT